MYIKILLLLLVLFTLNSSYQLQDSVIVLKEKDYPSIFKQFPFLMVELYAPWCGHCKKLAPIYTQLAQQLAAKGSQIHLAKVDTTAQKIWGQKFAVKGFPTLVFVKNAKQIPFKGSRTKQGMNNWLTKKMLDPIQEISLQEYNNLKSKNQVSIVFHGDIKSQKGKSLERMVGTDDYNYYYYNPNLGKPQDSLQMFRPFGQPLSHPKVDYKVKGWISANDRPVVVPFDDRMSSYAFSQGKPLLMFFNGGDHTNGDQNKFSKLYFEVATKYTSENPNKMRFTQFLKSDPSYDQWSTNLKVDVNMFPLILIHNGQKKKYVQNLQWDNVSLDSIQSFIKNWEKNSVKGYKLDDQVPQGQPKVNQQL